MNRKRVNRILAAKHEEFCASIKDSKVQRLVKKNGIITGGSIVSMLLGEPISDYDYYFLNLETVEVVANYYVKQFIELNPDNNIQPTVRKVDKRVKIFIRSAGIVADGEGDADYQYFEQGPDETAEQYVERMADITTDGIVREQKDDDDKPAYRPIFLSSNAITLSNKVQLVIRFYGKPDKIHKNYDFIHCTNYWTPDGGVVLNQHALETMLSKQLFYCGSLYPVCSVFRTRKFLKRGWTINAGQLLKMAFQISELDLTDIETLEDQLTGVDAAYFFQVIDYCKERMEKDKDFRITLPYLVSIIDKIF